jgi:hypothetical protein
MEFLLFVQGFFNSKEANVQRGKAWFSLLLCIFVPLQFSFPVYPG